jgi:ribosome-associated protein
MSDLIVTSRIVIAERELEERFIRSSGPGGQNVNKVASAVQLRFDVRASLSLPEPVRTALLREPGITGDGVLVITAQRFRQQERNRADARDRLAQIIRRAATPPKPRRATRVPKASKRKRLENKKHRAEIKRGRSKPD